MIDPRSYAFAEWAQKTTPLLAFYGNLPSQVDEKSWHAWASAVIALPGIAALGAPSPTGFANWKTWAFRFNQAMQLTQNL